MKSIFRVAAQFWTKPPEEIWDKIRVRCGLAQVTKFDRHVWCLSTGRVGTNTVAVLGQLMQGVHSLHEPKPLLFGLGKAAFESNHADANASLIAGVEACRRELFGFNQTTYLETSPHVTFVARQLKQVFPNSKFVHIIRHPVDVARSGMRRKWYSGNPTDIWRIQPHPDSDAARNWNRFDSLAKNIWSWSETNRWIESFLGEVPEEDKMLLTSESLFSGDEKPLRELFSLCDAPFPSKNKIERVLGKKLNSQTTGEFPSVKDWTPEQREQLQHLAGDVMDRYDYQIEEEPVR